MKKKHSTQEKISKFLHSQILFSILLLGISLYISTQSTNFISTYYPKRYVNPDLIFTLFPNNIFLEYFADILVYVCLLIFIFVYVKKYKQKISFYTNTISFMYILHSFIKILTPMMRPTGVDMPSHGVFRNFLPQLGMFPSGHVGLLATIYFLVEGEENKKLKTFFLITLILESITMVISRGHYSIDVIGGILLAYFVVNESKKYYFRAKLTSKTSSIT